MKLEQNEGWLRALFETAQDSIFLKDTDLKYIQVNPAMEKLFGLPASALIGRTDEELFGAAAGAHTRQVDTQVLGGQVIQEEHTKPVNDMPTTFHVIKVPLRDSTGQVIGLCGIARDITARVRAQEQIRAALREKEILLQEMHHRVKNNLQVISSLLNLQARQVQDERTAEMFHASQSRVISMALVHEKLYRAPDLTRVNLAEYIRNLATHLFHAYQVRARGIRLQVEVEEVTLGIDTAIPCGLIINELLSNALKHGFPQGREGEIYVGLQAQGAQLCLTVANDGVNFPLDLDFRNTVSLGLQLVITLVEQLDGEITLESGRRTTFKIEFTPPRRAEMDSPT